MPIAGARDTKIKIQSPTWSTSGLGERSASFATVATEWSEFKRLRGKEHERAQQIAHETECLFRVDYNSNTSPTNATYRITKGTRQYDILAVMAKPMGRPEWIEILAKTRNTDDVVAAEAFELEFDDAANSQYLAIGGL